MINILFLQFDFEIDTHGIEDTHNILRGSKTSSELVSKIMMEKSEDINPVFDTYQNIYMIDDSLYQNGFDIKNYNFVFFGFISKDKVIQGIVENYLLKHKVPYIKYGGSNNKLNDLSLIRNLGLNYIPTLITSSINESILSIVEKEFQYPVVVKHPHLQKGAGVSLVNSKKELLSKFRYNMSPLLIQQFIENDGDYRIIIFKNKLLLSAKRQKTNEDEFRNNIALGGKISNETPPLEIVKMCEYVSTKINFSDVLGFDIIQDKKSNTYYIMEINTGPHFFSFSVNSNIDVIGIFCDYALNNVKYNVNVGLKPSKTDINFNLCKKPVEKKPKVKEVVKEVEVVNETFTENTDKIKIDVENTDKIKIATTKKSFFYSLLPFINRK